MERPGFTRLNVALTRKIRRRISNQHRARIDFCMRRGGRGVRIDLRTLAGYTVPHVTIH